MNVHSENIKFRVLYVGNPGVVEQIEREFVQKTSLAVHAFTKLVVHFFSDVYAVAQHTSRVSADIIVIDERPSLSAHFKAKKGVALEKEDVLHTVTSERGQQGASAVTFETLKLALEKFTEKKSHYSMRRVLVILPQNARSSDREFHLAVDNVRGVVVDPENTLNLFLYIKNQLSEFHKNHKKTALCISGGGVEGYLYSLGVLHALEKCFVRKSLNDFDIFSGVSSGSILSSCLAAGLPADDLILQAHGKHPLLEAIGLNTIFDLATGEIAKRLLGFLRSLSLRDMGEFISRLQGMVPLGLFRGEKLRQFIERQLEHYGVENRMSALKKELYINATELDTCENIIFGEEPWKDIKISQAVRASTAVPPFYLPEKINGHWFTDGQLTHSSELSLAIRKGAGLIVYVLPVVAYTSNKPGDVMGRGGYFTLLQAVKSLVQNNSNASLRSAMDANPDADFVVFRPTDEVMEAMAGNPMKYHIRTSLIELGFRSTCTQILTSYEALAHQFAKHGFQLKSRDEISRLK